MPLFEVAIIEVPEKKKDEEMGRERLVFGPTPVIARDQQSAGMVAIMDNVDKLKDVDKSRLQVLIRPFA